MDPKVLKERCDKLLSVNHQWERSYQSLQAEYQEYQDGARRAQQELSQHLFALKERLAKADEQTPALGRVDKLREELQSSRKSLERAEKGNRELQEQLQLLQLKEDTSAAKFKLQVDTLRRERDQLKAERDRFKAQAKLSDVRERAYEEQCMQEQGLVARSVASPKVPDKVSQGHTTSTRNLPPPYLGQGSHQCSKCYHRFPNKKDLKEHALRCLI